MLGTAVQGIGLETRVLTIADREADFYDFLRTAVEQRHLVLVRANKCRALAGEEQAHL